MDKKHALSPTIINLESEIENYIDDCLSRFIRFNNSQAMMIRDLEKEVKILRKECAVWEKEVGMLRREMNEASTSNS